MEKISYKHLYALMRDKCLIFTNPAPDLVSTFFACTFRTIRDAAEFAAHNRLDYDDIVKVEIKIIHDEVQIVGVPDD